MELAALAAWIDGGGQIPEQRLVELPAGEVATHNLRIQARDARAQAAGDHRARERIRRARRGIEQRKERRQPGAGQPLFTVAPDVVEKEVAECRVCKPLLD